MPRFSILYLLLLLPPLAVGAQNVVLPEDCFPQLGTILAAAEGSSPALEQESSILDEAKAWGKDASSQRLPRVSAFARVQTQYEQRFNSEAQIDAFNVGPNAGLSLSVPLFHWGEFPARAAGARAHSEAARLRKEQRRLEIRQNLRRYYLEYQLAEQSVRVATEGIEFARRKQEGLKGLVDGGLAPRQDLVEADIFAQERQEDLDFSGSHSADCLGALRMISGMESLEVTSAEFPKLEFLSDADLDSLRIAASVAKVPALAALEAEFDAEKANQREIRSRNRPKVDAVASGGLDYTDEYQENGRYSTVPRALGWAGVQASWTLYDGGQIDALEGVSLARQRRLRAQIEEARLRQQNDIANIARDARLNAGRYATRLQRLELLKITLSYMEEQLAKGGVPANDYFQRRLDYQRTQLDLLSAGAYYMLDIAQLKDIASCSPGK